MLGLQLPAPSDGSCADRGRDDRLNKVGDPLLNEGTVIAELV